MQEKKSPFLQIWGQQLLREHSSICSRYNLKLTRPVIEVINVSSYWGKWLAASRTISLSQALVCNRPWDEVLNVLKHEMAHQLVTEVLGGAPGHGPDFKRACLLLGLPAPFRKAAAALATGKGGYFVPPPSATELVLTKVRKLLALTASTNEHEALLALQKARQLLHRHNLTDEIIGGQHNPPYVNLLLNLKKKRVESHHRAICSLLLDYFQIEIVITPLYDAHALTTYKCIDIMGWRENVEIAGYVYHFLMERLPVLWHHHRANHPGLKHTRQSYWLGVLDGFREGLARERRPEEKIPGPARSGLLPATRDDQALGLFVRSRYPKLRQSGKRTARIDLAGFEAGIAAGRDLKFRTGLNGDNDAQRLLAP